MMSHTIQVELGSRRYPIQIGIGHDLGAFIRQVAPRSTQAMVVTDANVRLHAEALERQLTLHSFSTNLVSVPAGEGSKSLAMAEFLYDQLADWPADRRTLVVAVGGGVVGDLAGFAAATYARGLSLVMVPTTLLAMVDSSVGGKVGINHPRGKNLIGAFHQPLGVAIDPDYLHTLPEREFRSGLAEVVKYGVIMDADFFAFLEAHQAAILARDPETISTVVARSCRLKADVVEQDEHEETGHRMILNYGHTFAHAFESVAGYRTWLHGEAVAAGMMAASRLAERLGLIESSLTTRQHKLLEAFGLPLRHQPEWPIDDMVQAMYRDKKALAGRLRLILPTRLGEVRLVDDVDETLVREVLRAS